MNSTAPDGDADDELSTVDRATQMRASLGARRDVEVMLVEAAQLLQQASTDAEATVEEGLEISQALVAESREQAAAIISRAHVEAYRASVQAESSEEGRRELARVREQSDTLIGAAEDAVRGLGADLEQAGATVLELLQTLGELRTRALGPLPVPAAGAPASSGLVETFQAVEPSIVGERSVASFAEAGTGGAAVVEVPTAPAAQEEPDPPEAGDETRLGAGRTEIGADLRDQGPALRRGSATTGPADRVGRTSESGETLEVMPDAEKRAPAPEPDSRPLGWLFRSAR